MKDDHGSIRASANRVLVRAAVAACLLAAPSSGAGSGPSLEVFPLFYDFGRVGVGTSERAIVVLLNAGEVELTIHEISLRQDRGGDFSLEPIPALPAKIPKEGTLDVEIVYSPSAKRISENFLKIRSDAKGTGIVTVTLRGTGGRQDVSPVRQITEILEFIDESYDAGTLRPASGSGRGKNDIDPLIKLKHMSERAQYLIDEGQTASACQVLLEVYRRSDGLPDPSDYVTGKARGELARMVSNLRARLRCP